MSPSHWPSAQLPDSCWATYLTFGVSIHLTLYPQSRVLPPSLTTQSETWGPLSRFLSALGKLWSLDHQTPLRRFPSPICTTVPHKCLQMVPSSLFVPAAQESLLLLCVIHLLQLFGHLQQQQQQQTSMNGWQLSPTLIGLPLPPLSPSPSTLPPPLIQTCQIAPQQNLRPAFSLVQIPSLCMAVTLHRGCCLPHTPDTCSVNMLLYSITYLNLNLSSCLLVFDPNAQSLHLPSSASMWGLHSVTVWIWNSPLDSSIWTLSSQPVVVLEPHRRKYVTGGQAWRFKPHFVFTLFPNCECGVTRCLLLLWLPHHQGLPPFAQLMLSFSGTVGFQLKEWYCPRFRQLLINSLNPV